MVKDEKKSDGKKEYDVIILGAGPAGLSAGIYAARYGLRVLILSENIGGTINYAEKIENFPGFVGSGPELIKKFAEQAKSIGCEIILNKVIDVVKVREGFKITTKEQEFFSKSLIIALGTEKKKLNIKGEEKFIGKGISYCATCDAAFFRGKDVVVIGGCDSSAHTALLLAKIAKKVYILYRKCDLRCQALLYDEIKANKKIEIINDAVPVEILGKDIVNWLVYDKIENGKIIRKQLKVDGIFIEIGSVPSNYLTDKIGIAKDKEGFVIVNDKMETNVIGVFSAGDINSGSIKQALIASASGAISAISAYNYVRNQKISEHKKIVLK